MSEWVQRKCSTCERKFFVRTEWLNPPNVCDYCRAMQVGDVIIKLKQYLLNRKKYDSKQASSFDREIMLKDRETRAKIESIISKIDLDYNALMSELLQDKDIRKLIIRIDNNSKISNNARSRYNQQKTGTFAITTNVLIFQGGSPGLGKKA